MGLCMNDQVKCHNFIAKLPWNRLLGILAKNLMALYVSVIYLFVVYYVASDVCNLLHGI